MILDRSGLTDGERINSCSTMAQLYFPRFLCISNGFGRLRLDYRDLCAQLFPRWPDSKIPKAAELMGYVREYQEHRLLFVYKNSAQTWGQWDSKHGTFGKYHTAEDKRSPAPPEDAWNKWVDDNRQKSVHTSEVLVEFNLIPVPENLPEGSEKLEEFFENVSANFPRGIGVGIGDGVTCMENGEGIKPSARKARGPVNNSKVQKVTGENRHGRIRELVKNWYQEWASAECPWDGGEAGQLDRLLRASPGFRDDQIAACLENLARSDCIACGSRPREWLGRLHEFLHGPLDRFWKPIGGNGNGQHEKQSAPARRMQQLGKNFAAALRMSDAIARPPGGIHGPAGGNANGTGQEAGSGGKAMAAAANGSGPHQVRDPGTRTAHDGREPEILPPGDRRGSV